MKQWRLATIILVAAGLVALARSGGHEARGQPPAAYRDNPFAPQPPVNAVLRHVAPGAGPTAAPGGTVAASRQAAPAAAADPADEEGPEPNQDIVVTPELGEWMICVASYTGENCHAYARQMVAHLRDHAGPYKLHAYVFNYGAEERRQERERVQKLIREQQELARQYNQAVPMFKDEKGTVQPYKIRVRTIRREDQVAVLIACRGDREAVRRRLEEVRKLPAPDPDRVKLDATYVFHKTKDDPSARGQWSYVNPFQKGFIVRNPALPKQEVAAEGLDLDALRRLNADESYSLLDCPKKYTLAIREFRTPVIIQQTAGPSKSVWDKFGAGASGDGAAESAHNLAELFRKGNLDAYVLHTKVSSVVTVGGFDSLEDPRLRLTAERLGQLCRDPRYDKLGLFPVPRPMQVPQ